MKWTIMIATVPQRSRELARLLHRLYPQLTDEVELLINGKDLTPIGLKRQAMLCEAKGEYVNFIDDDDMVPEDYVETLLPLMDGTDYIGFQLQMYNQGRKEKPTYHNLKYTEWCENQIGYYRGVSHLNPIRRDIALKGKFEGGAGEDKHWADQVQPYCETAHYVDRVMYHYYFDYTKSLTQGRNNG